VTLGGRTTSSQLPLLDHLFRFAGWAACLLAIGTNFGLYADWCVSARALLPAISFGAPSHRIGVRGSYAGPDENCLLLAFRGRLSKEYFVSKSISAQDKVPAAQSIERPDNPSN
jgi:hypothetical protein